MATCEWVILSDYAIEANDNKLSIIGMFENIRVAQLPGGVPQFVVAIRLSGDPNEKVSLSVAIESTTSAKVLETQKATVTLTPAGMRHVTAVFQGLSFAEYGVYAVKVFLNDMLARTGSLIVDRQ
jgi:hypothetical protein